MGEVFTITPASTKPLWFLAAILALLLLLLLLFIYIGYSSRWTRFEITADGLAVRGTLYGRAVPWSSLRADEARMVNLRESPDYQPTLRTNGVGLPGYQAGWFSLRGAGRGLLFVTDPTRVVAVPTSDGYTLLQSVREPDAFVGALRRAARGAP
jgi:hypothetical protein